MIIFNVADPTLLILLIFGTGALVFLAREVYKSIIPMILLMGYVVLLVIHVAQSLGGNLEASQAEIIYRCIVVDFLFILATFLAYLWIDEKEAEVFKKKTIDKELNWFWKKG